MANTILTPSEIAKEAAVQVVNNLSFGRLAYKEFKNDFNVKIGDTVTFRKPVRFEATDGAVLNVQNVEEKSDTIVINKRKHVAWQFDSSELTLKIDEYAERYIKPAAITLANQIDLDGGDLYLDVYNAAGSPGSNPDFPAVLDTRQKLNEFAVPQNSRYLAVNPKSANKILSALTTFFQPSMIQDIVKEAALGRIAQMDLYEAQNVKTHTAGTAVAANIVVNAIPTENTNIVSLDLSSGTGTLKKGDILTFSSSNAVNPIGKQDTGSLQQFVVTADASLSTTPVNVTVSPNFISTGAYKNITSLPQTSDTVTRQNSHIANLAWHKNAFSLVTVPLVAPQGAVWAETVNFQGVGLRMIRDYDMINDQEVVRLDVLYGWKTTYPELAARLMAQP